MKLKVCGMKHPDNIKKLQVLRPDLMGLIFYDRSPRCVERSGALSDLMHSISSEKVGVYVNEAVEQIRSDVELFGLDYVQLHGDESPDEVKNIRSFAPVIKAFSVDRTFDFSITDEFSADYFLFDAKGEQRGGNGIQFSWSKLNEYHGEVPFFLSGGLTLKDAKKVKKIQHPKLKGVDINSGFEDAPGLKNIDAIAEFKLELDEVYC